MAPQQAPPKEERKPTMAPPRLQTLAINSLPANQTLKFATSTWIGIIFHQIRDMSHMKEETSFLWIKAHPRVTVRTLKYMYYARHPLEEFALKHLDYYPDEDDQVQHLCARSPFAGSSVVVLRAVEDMFAPQIDRFDAWEARIAEKLGKNSYEYHAQEDRITQLDDSTSDEEPSKNDHCGNAQTKRHESMTISEQSLSLDKLSDTCDDHDLVSTKFSDFTEQQADFNQTAQHNSSNVKGEGPMSQGQISVAQYGDWQPADHPTFLESKLSEAVDQTRASRFEAAVGQAIENTAAEEFRTEEIETSGAPEHSQAHQTVQETIVHPFTDSVLQLLIDRMATLPKDAYESMTASKYLACAVPICYNTLMLQPWTQFVHDKAMCTECSEASMRVQVMNGTMTVNTFEMNKRLMSHQLAMKQQRARWGEQVNMSDDVPAEHSGPLPDLAEYDDQRRLPQTPPQAHASLRSEDSGQEQTHGPRSSPVSAIPLQQVRLRDNSPPRFASPPRSAMTFPQTMSLSGPMDTSTDSFFGNAANASPSLGPATWTARNQPQSAPKDDFTIDPAQLFRKATPQSPQVRKPDDNMMPPSSPMQPPANVNRQCFAQTAPTRPAFTNFARPGIIKMPSSFHQAPAPAARQPAKRSAADLEDEIQAELADLGGKSIADCGPRALRRLRQSNLRYSKNATASDDDFVANDDEGDVYSDKTTSPLVRAKGNGGSKVLLKLRIATTGLGTQRAKRSSAYGFADSDDEYAALHEPLDIKEAAEDDDDEWTPEPHFD